MLPWAEAQQGAAGRWEWWHSWESGEFGCNGGFGDDGDRGPMGDEKYDARVALYRRPNSTLKVLSRTTPPIHSYCQRPI